MEKIHVSIVPMNADHLVHRKTGTNDLRLDLISDVHKILLFSLMKTAKRASISENLLRCLM